MAEAKKDQKQSEDQHLAQQVRDERAALEERDQPVTYIVNGKRVDANGEPVDEK